MSPSRRALLRAAGAAVAGGLAGCSDVFGSRTPTETATPVPVPDLRAWEVDVGDRVDARPVVADELVYAAVGGEDDSELVALARADGSERGRHAAAGRVVGSTVGVGDGCAFATARAEPPRRGVVTMLDANGSVRWRTDAARRGRPTCLGATGDAVYVGWHNDAERRVGTPLEGEPSTGDGTTKAARTSSAATATPTDASTSPTRRGVAAYDPSDGRARWSPSGPSVTDGTVAESAVFALTDYPRRLYVTAPGDGRELWTREASTVPTVASGVAYLVTDALLALDARTGMRRWRALADVGVRSVAADGRGVYVGGEDGEFRALARADASPRWTAQLGGVDAPAAVTDGTVYAVGNGVLAAFDANSGAERWRTDLGAGSATPVLGDGVVYVRLGRHLHVVARETGERRLSFTPAGDAALTPVAVGPDGRAYVGDDRGRVYALDGSV